MKLLTNYGLFNKNRNLVLPSCSWPSLPRCRHKPVVNYAYHTSGLLGLCCYYPGLYNIRLVMKLYLCTILPSGCCWWQWLLYKIALHRARLLLGWVTVDRETI